MLPNIILVKMWETELASLFIRFIDKIKMIGHFIGFVTTAYLVANLGIPG